jgi:hypothetical protein
MKKPNWLSLLAGIAIFASASFLTALLFHHPATWDTAAWALTSGLGGGTLTWYFALRNGESQ